MKPAKTSAAERKIEDTMKNHPRTDNPQRNNIDSSFFGGCSMLGGIVPWESEVVVPVPELLVEA